MTRDFRLLLAICLPFVCLSADAQVRRPRVADDGSPAHVYPGQQTQAAGTNTGGRHPAVVILNEPSVAEYLAVNEPQAESVQGGGKRQVDAARVRTRLFSDEGKSRLASIQAHKAPLTAQLQQRGIPIHSQAEHAINAIMLDATEEELAWLRQQPSVKSAQWSGRKHVTLDAAAKLIGAPAVWAQVGQDQAGHGVKIAILDSGIQIQNGPMFSDSGYAAATLPAGRSATNASTGGTYTNNKVIVAKNYVCPSSVNGSSCPFVTTGATVFDHSASDGLGHGTFVASVAAGRSASTTIGTTISGIAPGAYLGNYKVFDSTGNADDSAIIQALNDAVADGFDVINFSGGGDCGTQQPGDDPYTTLVKNAVDAGVVVAFPAGNDGPGGGGDGCPVVGDNTISSPGEVPDAITAGASTNSHTIAQAIRVVAPVPVPDNLAGMAFSSSDIPPLTSNIGPAVAVDVSTVDSTKQACSALPAGSLSGKIPVIQRGNCTFATKAFNAGNAGAIGVVFYDNVSEALIALTTAGPPVPQIPSGIVSVNDGTALTAFLALHPGQVQIQIDSAPAIASQQGDQVSDYSSRGPNPDFAIKPDLVAPGDMYGATQSLNSNGEIYAVGGFIYAEGTSFATPMTAGAAAVVKQLRPSLTARDVKSALVNTATLVTSTQDGSTASVMNTGGGRLSLPAAVATTLVSDPVSISFGQQTSGTAGGSHSVTLKNVGTASETFNVSIAQNIADGGLKLSADKQIVSIAAGSTATLALSAVTSATETGVFEGFVNLSSTTSSTKIHIPYWVMFGTPTANVGGLVDGAGFGKTVGLGSIVSLFGVSMGGPAAVNAAAVPLPVDLNHTTVLITGRDTSTTPPNQTITQSVPLFYGSAGQINFQLPYTLSTGRNDSLQVAVEGVQSSPISFQPSAFGPGIFTSQGTGVLVHADNSLITPANPATANETIVIYCTGLGAVSPAAQTGSAATQTPLQKTPSNPTVMIGNQPAVVSFSGLTPALVGLYQVNATVPAGLIGAQSVTLTIGGATSNSVVTYLK